MKSLLFGIATAAAITYMCPTFPQALASMVDRTARKAIHQGPWASNRSFETMMHDEEQRLRSLRKRWDDWRIIEGCRADFGEFNRFAESSGLPRSRQDCG